MILQLSASNRYGRNHTFTDISSLRKFIRGVARHPAGPNALKGWTLIAPAASVEFALNAVEPLPKTIIVHGSLELDAIRRIRDIMGADREMILL